VADWTEMGIGGKPGGSNQAGTYSIDPDFIILYQAMGGATIVGNPVAEPVHNYQKQRVEQYFERAGFYHLFSEAAGIATCCLTASWPAARLAVRTWEIPISMGRLRISKIKPPKESRRR